MELHKYAVCKGFVKLTRASLKGSTPPLWCLDKEGGGKLPEIGETSDERACPGALLAVVLDNAAGVLSNGWGRYAGGLLRLGDMA